MTKLQRARQILGPVSPEKASGARRYDFVREERAGLNFMFGGRILVLGILALWIVLTVPFDRAMLYLVVIFLFFLFGAIPYFVVARGYGGTGTIAAFLFLDAAVLSYLLIVPNPYGLEGWSPQMNLRAPGFLYLGLFLVYMSLSYRPALVIWAGVAAIASWSIGNFWVISLPETRAFSSSDVLGPSIDISQVYDRVLDPYAVGLARLVNQVVFLAAATLILTLTVWRSRELARRKVVAEKQRSALSRYFSPNLVDKLAHTERPFDTPRVQRVAVLFADIVGFTSLSEKMSPIEVVELLRDFHGRLARAALDHRGTVDKFLGDAIMVHFGTPDPAADDAEHALRCAAAMISEVAELNTLRRAQSKTPISIGIGLHYGDVVAGNIGDAERLEYTVLGDTVNVASRLEAATRDLNTQLVVSDQIVEAVRAAGVEPTDILSGLHTHEPISVRGRRELVPLWCL